MNSIETIGRLVELEYLLEVKNKAEKGLWDSTLRAVGEAVNAIRREDADGCTDCKFETKEEWEPPCDRCRRSCKDYWREKGQHEEEEQMKRKEILETAIKTVCESRQSQYGDPEDTFSEIARLWTVYIGCPVSPRDVAIMMLLLEVARSKNGQDKDDNYADIAGYAACAAESREGQDGIIK